MQTKTKWLVAGGLAAAFAYAGTLWSMYPANRDMTASLYNDAGVKLGLWAPTPPPAKLQYLINAGFATARPQYLPRLSAEGCGDGGNALRLSYSIALVADEKRADILALPRIGGDEQRYIEERRNQIARAMQAGWQAEIAARSAITQGIDFVEPGNALALQQWLSARADALYRDLGVKVAFSVNAENAVTAPSAAPSACPR